MDDDINKAIEAMERAANAPHLGEALVVPKDIRERLRRKILEHAKAQKEVNRAIRVLERIRSEQNDIWDEIRGLHPDYEGIPVVEYDKEDGQVKVGMDEEAQCRMIASAVPHGILDAALEFGFPPGLFGKALHMAADRCKCESCAERRKKEKPA